MYELYKIGENTYQIHSTFSNVRAMEGSLNLIVKYMVMQLYFSANEIEYALLDMIGKEHDSAQFGMNRTYLFSFEKLSKYGNNKSA